MKTTLKKLSIPKPKGGYDELYVDDFATKEELAALKDTVYKLHFDKDEVTDLHPFYIKSLEDENVVYSSSMYSSDDNVPCRLSNDAANVEYSYDGIWHNLAEVESITLNKDERVYFRYIGEDYLQGTGLTNPTKTFEVGGDLRSVIYGDMAREDAGEMHYRSLFKEVSTLVSAEKLNLGVKKVDDFSCQYMFSGCVNLIYSPKIMQATTLGQYCYRGMFEGCTSLTTAPELPATNLSVYCYNNMFSDCTSLTTAPELPATVLGHSCYDSMFSGCTSLVTAPELPATNLNTLALFCYSNMFKDCTSLTIPPSILPAKEVNYSAYMGMFSGCTSLEKTPILLFDKVSSGSESTDIVFGSCYEMFKDCYSLKKVVLPKVEYIPCCAYSRMFIGCTSLEYVYIPSANLDSNFIYDEISSKLTTCCNEMFQGCSSLKEIFCNFGEIPTFNHTIDDGVTYTSYPVTYNWLNGVAAEGKFVQSKDANWERGVSGIPEGWEVEDWHDDYFYLESLDDEGVVTLKERFGLADAPAEYTTNRVTWQPTEADMQLNVRKGERVYIRRVSGDASFTTINDVAIFNTETRLKIGGNVDKLMQDYTLESVTLRDYCYMGLFRNISNIVDAGEFILPATTLASHCYNSMFNGCSSLTTAPELPATTLADYCYSYMFVNCKSLVNAPELPATTMVMSCYSHMFEGCSSLVVPPELPATNTYTSCYSNMFKGCTSLTTAPYLPALAMTTECYYYMFYGCSKLSEIKCNAVALAMDSTFLWVYGVAREGMFYHNVNATCWSDDGGESDIPEGWVRLAITD